MYILKLDARQQFGIAAVANDPFIPVGDEFHNPVVVKLGANKVERQNAFALPRYGILRVNFSRLALPDEIEAGFNPDLDLPMVEATERALSWKEQGYIDLFGQRYIPLDQSSSGVKAAEAEFILDGFRDAYLDWWHCGCQLSGLDLHTQVEKDARALTTCLPHEYYFGEVAGLEEHLRGIIPPLTAEGMILMPKVKTKDHKSLEGRTRLVNLTKETVEGVEPGKVGVSGESWEETDSDGVLYQILDNTGNDKYAERLNTLAKKGALIGFTINAPGHKGCVQPILKSSLITLLEEEVRDGFIPETSITRDEEGHLISCLLPDAWGNLVDILKATSIGTPDTFKWFKAAEMKSYEGWLNYVKGFVAYGHTFDVSVVPHVVWRHMPYQMTIGLLQSVADADWMINREVNTIQGYKNPENAKRLLPKAMRKALDIYTALWQDKFVQFSAQSAYTKKRWNALAAKIDRAGKYYFLAPDTVGIFRSWCGDNRPYIKAGNIIQPGTKTGEKVIMARNPFPGLNFCPRTRQEIEEKYIGLYCNNSVYVSMMDDSMARMQADFDGDKCFIIEDDEIYDLVIKALAATGYLTVRWAKEDGQNPQFNWDVFWEHILMANTSEVGLICAGIIKVRAVDAQSNKNWETSTTYNLDNLAKGEAACTLDIDAAKGKGAKVQAWYDIMESAKYFYAKRPLHLAYQKSSPSSVKEDLFYCAVAEEFEKSKFYGHYLPDYATQLIGVHTDETLYVDAHSEESFKYLRLTSDPRHTKGKAGLSNLLDEAIKEFKVEYARLCAATDNSMATSEFTRNYYSTLRVKILARGALAGMTQEETIDALIKTVYNGYDESFDISKHERKFRILWTCFGEEIVCNLKANLGIKAEEIADKADIDDSDIDESYELMASEEDEDFSVLEDDLCFEEDSDGFFFED